MNAFDILCEIEFKINPDDPVLVKQFELLKSKMNADPLQICQAITHDLNRNYHENLVTLTERLHTLCLKKYKRAARGADVIMHHAQNGLYKDLGHCVKTIMSVFSGTDSHYCSSTKHRCGNCSCRMDKDKFTCPGCGRGMHLCRLGAMSNGRCHNHGGKAPRGVAHPLYQHGRRVGALNYHQNIQQKYIEALQDTERIKLIDELALIDARINDLLSGLYSQEGQIGLLGELNNELDALKTEVGKGKITDANKRIQTIYSILKDQRRESQIWRETGDWIEKRRKVVDTERRRVADERAFISPEQFMGFVEKLGRMFDAALNKYVEPRIRRKVMGAYAIDLERELGSKKRNAVLVKHE